MVNPEDASWEPHDLAELKKGRFMGQQLIRVTMRNIAMSGNDNQQFQRVERVGIVDRVEKQPPHSRDFSRELGSFFLQILVTYGIISTWIIML